MHWINGVMFCLPPLMINTILAMLQTDELPRDDHPAPSTTTCVRERHAFVGGPAM